MAAWAGGQCELQYATFAGIGGYLRLRTRQIAPRKPAARPCGTKAGLTAGHGKRESRWGEAANCDSGEALKNPDQKTAAYSERVFMPRPELIFVARFEIPAKSVLF
jgi:hypothetical protein